MNKFYYINLKKSIDRKKNMETFFKNLSKIIDLEYERIEAFDGNNEIIDNYLINSKFKNMYSSLKSERNQSSNINLTKSEFGCLYSHIKALHAFLKTDDPYCFICEDDLDPDILQVYTEDYFKNKISYILSIINKYGIISLSCVGNYKIIKKIISNKSKFITFHKYLFYGTGCYIITKDIAKYIINKYVIVKNNIIYLKLNELKTSMVADNFIYQHSKTKFIIPSLFYTKNFDSLINNNTGNHEKVQNIMKQSYINK